MKALNPEQANVIPAVIDEGDHGDNLDLTVDLINWTYEYLDIDTRLYRQVTPFLMTKFRASVY